MRNWLGRGLMVAGLLFIMWATLGCQGSGAWLTDLTLEPGVISPNADGVADAVLDVDDVLARELAGSMLSRIPPSVGLLEGIMSAVTCFAIDEAMDTGKVIDVDPYWNRVNLNELTNSRFAGLDF